VGSAVSASAPTVDHGPCQGCPSVSTGGWAWQELSSRRPRPAPVRRAQPRRRPAAQPSETPAGPLTTPPIDIAFRAGQPRLPDPGPARHRATTWPRPRTETAAPMWAATGQRRSSSPHRSTRRSESGATDPSSDRPSAIRTEGGISSNGSSSTFLACTCTAPLEKATDVRSSTTTVTAVARCGAFDIRLDGAELWYRRKAPGVAPQASSPHTRGSSRTVARRGR